MPLDPETGARFRINAKQTAGNKWYLDATVEYKSDKVTRTISTTDGGDIIIEPLGARLWSLIKGAEDEGRRQGRNLVSDVKEKEPEPKKTAPKKEIKK